MKAPCARLSLGQSLNLQQELYREKEGNWKVGSNSQIKRDSH